MRSARHHEPMGETELTEAEVNDLLNGDDRDARWEDDESYEWVR